MVRQFTINLNRQEGFAQREERRRRTRSRITLSTITILLLIVGGLTLRNDRAMHSMIHQKQRQLDHIVAQIDSLQKEGQNVSKEDVIALARLDGERVLWTKKFNAIAERIPDQMAITGLKFDRGKFEIHAISQIRPGDYEFDKVKMFMDRLKAMPVFMEDFKDIKFKESKRVKRDDQEILNFTVTCQLGAPGTSSLKHRGRVSRATRG